jgi:hypothetical protein
MAFDESSAQRCADRAFLGEALLLGRTALTAIGIGSGPTAHPLQLHAVIALSTVAMGLRNAIVRKLAVPDLTTAVLTLTITGLAADSSLAGGENPRWQRRGAAILAMVCGAFAGAPMLAYSISLPLAVASGIGAMCAPTRGILFQNGENREDCTWICLELHYRRRVPPFRHSRGQSAGASWRTHRACYDTRLHLHG